MMKKQRSWIMHVDMDAFYASVEQRDNPDYRGKPVIVGGNTKRCVVATASYEARKFGVHSAMSIMLARRKCPTGIFVTPRFTVYKKISKEIHEIMLHYAETIEPLSLDEAFMDISGMGSQYKTLDNIGTAIKKEIKEKVGLIASVGIAPNKFLAKMASDLAKPDGLYIIPYGKEASTLKLLPVRKLWGVGHITEKKLLQSGFKTIGDIQQVDITKLAKIVGNQAKRLKNLSLGIDHRPIVSKRIIKSISDESTYETDLNDIHEISKQISLHSDIVAKRLRAHNLSAATITLKIKFASFKSISRSMSLIDPTCLASEIDMVAQKLLQRMAIKEGVRLIGVTGSHLTKTMEMMNLFSDRKERYNKVASVVDEIQHKYGEMAIRRGIWLEDEIHSKKKKKEDS